MSHRSTLPSILADIDMTHRSTLSSILAALTLLLALYAPLGASAAGPGADRRELQLQQQQDALNLNLQQGLRAPRYDLGPADARRLDQLQLQQRLEQSQLDQQQLQRDYLLSRNAASPSSGALDGEAAAQRQIFAQERQFQNQRFDMEQQQLLQSAPRQPLQPTPLPGQLNLP
jgi:hypothetical protein